MIHVQAIEIPEVVRPNMDDLTLDLTSRTNILLMLTDKMFENIKALEQIHQIQIFRASGFNELCYMAHELLDSVLALQKSHEELGWKLAK
ncbi:hypothetical protein [Rhizobium sp. Rhizsp82]|uniref:hypothetical protein n=1 Tax=Rhizobium sp. Rhizsp82 TaxID=3243057 RepID=UPI0039B4E2B0